MKILIMGLPGSGKTWLAERLQKALDCAWYNADEVRKMANDWDFTPEGRLRQANRMRTIADYEVSHNRIVMCDFVCPTAEARAQFAPDKIIWVDTIQEGRFEDTNKIFEKPSSVDIHITKHLSDKEIEQLSWQIL
jgi:adenylylsulfate kinase